MSGREIDEMKVLSVIENDLLSGVIQIIHHEK